MPVYLFRCDACGSDTELLRRLGDVTPPLCPDCGVPTRHRLARVAVKYDAFGFTQTDNLVADPANRDMKALRERAEQISDG